MTLTPFCSVSEPHSDHPGELSKILEISVNRITVDLHIVDPAVRAVAMRFHVCWQPRDAYQQQPVPLVE